MTHIFLSDEWFVAVDEIRDQVGNLEVDGPARELVINVKIKDTPYGMVELHMKAGKMERGLAEAAPTTINLPYDLAYAMFIAGDQSAGMTGFMSGKITVDGDMTKLMAMQGGSQPEGAAELQKRIADATLPIGG